MNSTIGASMADRVSRIIFSAPRSVDPLASARSDARWITGPSASGSENGIPTSRTSAPFFASETRISAVRARSGSPAVTKATSPGCFVPRMRLNAAAMRDISVLPPARPGR